MSGIVKDWPNDCFSKFVLATACVALCGLGVLYTVSRAAQALFGR